MWTCILIFALGLVSLSQSLTSYRDPGQMLGLSLVFPPYAFATLIRDIATAEYGRRAFPSNDPSQLGPSINRYLYFACFLVHIFIYGGLIFLVEHIRWGVPRTREWTETSDAVALKSSHLSKTYSKKKKAVKDFNAEIQTGSVTFLLGPNGSGETTTLKCISGILKVDDGSKIQLSQDGLSFGLCPQNNVLWGDLSILELADVVRDRMLAVFSKLGLTVMRYFDTRGIIQFFIRYDKKDLGRIMSAMEVLKTGVLDESGDRNGEGSVGTKSPQYDDMRVFDDYTLIEPSLEETFMNVVKEGE